MLHTSQFPLNIISSYFPSQTSQCPMISFYVEVHLYFQSLIPFCLCDPSFHYLLICIGSLGLICLPPYDDSVFSLLIPYLNYSLFLYNLSKNQPGLVQCSQRGVIFGSDIFAAYTWAREYYWLVRGRGQGCC